jgi:hypothetical protein
MESTVTRERKEGAFVEVPGREATVPIIPRIQIELGAGRDGIRLRHGQLTGPDFVFVDEELRSLTKTVTQRWIAQGEASATSHSDALPGVLGGFGEVPVTLRWQFRMGKAPDLGWIEAGPLPGGKPWWPEWGGHRDFTIKLNRPEWVQALEVHLEDVSDHPGVALNAVETVLTRPKGWDEHRRDVPVEFREAGTSLKWTRSRVEPVPGAGDRAPDLWLNAADHPGATRADSAPRAQRLTFSEAKPEIPLRVRAEDYSAQGRLGVRVKVDGFWEDLPVKGAGAMPDRPRLGLPLDENADGLPDGFLTTGVPDGDGLSPAQEYRGVIAGGKHRRLSPLRREVFLTDPSGRLRPEDREAMTRRLLESRVDLIFLEEGETVMGEVPVIGVERLQEHFWPKLLRLEDAVAQRDALRAIRPRSGVDTLFVGERPDSRFLAADLARILNLELPNAQP